MEKSAVIEELIALRKKEGLSQRALASKMGVGQYVIGRIEAGRVSPRLSTVIRILDALNGTLEVISDKEGETMTELWTRYTLPKELQPMLEGLEASTNEEERQNNQQKLSVAIRKYEKKFKVRDDQFSLIKHQFLNPNYIAQKESKEKKLLYHGSTQIVWLPQKEYCEEENDFGKCFYTTEYLSLAKEWAGQSGKAGFVSGYELRTDGLAILNLNSDEYTILNWVSTLLQYRNPAKRGAMARNREYLLENFAVDTSKADVIIGYRADDSYFRYVKDFLGGTISLETLGQAMRLGKLGEQVVIQSEKAFERLIFMRSFRANENDIFAYQKRDTKARHAYEKLPMAGEIPEDQITINTIVQERMKNDDPRLQQPVYRGCTREPWRHV